MSTPTSNGLQPAHVPPDPGGRSRYLIRALVIACLVGVAVIVFLLLALRRAGPGTAPPQQPAGQIRLPAGPLLA